MTDRRPSRQQSDPARRPSRHRSDPAHRPSRHRRILGLAVPAIGTLVADPLMGFVDTAVVGRLGAEQLGALGLAVAVLAAVSWVFNFLVYGTTASVARAVGSGDRAGAGRRIAHAAQLAALLGIVMALLVLLAADPLVRASGAVAELVAPAATYLRVRAVGVPFLLLGYVGHGAFRGVSDTRTPLWIVIVANAVNAGLTLLLVFPVGLGIAGAAWGTVAAEVLTVVAFLVLLRRKPLRAASTTGAELQDGIRLRGHGLPSRGELSALVAVSRDLFLRTGGLVVGLLLIAAAAARIDAVTAAAHQVLWQVWIIVSFFMDGFAIAAQAMVGTALGAGDRAEARGAARDLLWWGLGGGAAIAMVLLALVGLVPLALTNQSAVLAAVGAAWWLAAGGHVLNGMTFVLDGVFMGAGDFAYLRTWTVVAAVAGAVTAQTVATLGGGVVGIWVAVEVMMLVRFVSLAVRVRGDAWIRTGTALPAEAWPTPTE